MPDLETQIAAWRRQMLAAGIKTPSTLDELESHLREEIDRLRATGVSETEALSLAVSRLGQPATMQVEFKKLGRPALSAANVVTAVWAGLILLLILIFLPKLLDRKPNVLLLTHILTVTAGYLAAFVVGGCGMAWVCWQWRRGVAPARHEAINRTALRFTRLAAGFIVLAVALGMIWSGPNLGAYFIGDFKEIGGICAAAWFIGLWLAQRSPRITDRATMLLAICGSLIVSVAWFGAGPLAHAATTSGYGLASYWPLAVLTAIHLLFLTAALLRPFRPAKA